MFIRNYSVRVVNQDRTHPKEDEKGYVLLKHNTQYKLILRNQNSVKCEAEVSIDGDRMGTFILQPKETLSLERPVNDNGFFTFFKLGSEEASISELDQVHKNLLGLVSVTFTPEKPVKHKTLRKAFPYPEPKPYPKIWSDEFPLPIKGSFGGVQGSSNRGEMKIASSSSVMDFGSSDKWEPIGAFMNNVGNSTVTTSASPGGTGLSGHSGQMFMTVPGLNLDHSNAVTINLRLICNESEEEVRPKKPFSTPIPPPVYGKGIRGKK